MTARPPLRAHRVAFAFGLTLGLALCGCSVPVGLPGLSRAQAQACRQRTDEVFLLQNRGELYRTDSYVSGARDTPFSGGGGGATSGGIGANNYSDGLSGQYARQQALTDCYNRSAAPATPPATP